MFDAADDHGVLALRGNAGTLQQLDDSVGRAGPDQRIALCEPSDVVGMEAVDVLCRIDRLDDRVRIDVIRQRQLDQDAIGRVAVEVGDDREQFGLGRRLGRSRATERMPASSQASRLLRT